ncbi:MAG: hypothetical protein ACFE8L_11865 [Candidatus Hodarchaeota archaeon]
MTTITRTIIVVKTNSSYPGISKPLPSPLLGSLSCVIFNKNISDRTGNTAKIYISLIDLFHFIEKNKNFLILSKLHY